MLGFVAGVLTTFASLPQIIYVVRTRSMNDVSLVTLCMLATGCALWLVYGAVIHAAPVIVWNALSLLLYLMQLGLKLTLSPLGAPIIAQLRRIPARSSA